MTDPSSTVDNTPAQPPAQPPNPPAQQPSQPSTQPSANPGPSNQDGPLARLETAIAGLPEALANAVAERSPKPPAQPQRQTPKPGQQQQPSAPQGSGSQSSANPATQSAVPGKKKSFAEWWFGGSGA